MQLAEQFIHGEIVLHVGFVSSMTLVRNVICCHSVHVRFLLPSDPMLIAKGSLQCGCQSELHLLHGSAGLCGSVQFRMRFATRLQGGPRWQQTAGVGVQSTSSKKGVQNRVSGRTLW